MRAFTRNVRTYRRLAICGNFALDFVSHISYVASQLFRFMLTGLVAAHRANTCQENLEQA